MHMLTHRPLIGCCGWAGSQSQYFDSFPTIEIQSTFYDPPAVKVAQRWRAMAPSNFVFCLKAWQLITHPASSPTYRRLRHPIQPGQKNLVGGFLDTEEVWNAWRVTREIATNLRAVVVLFQCPASFRATHENVRNFRRFFRKLGTQPFQLSWEPRGPWPPELVRDLCTDCNLIHCMDPFVSRPVHSSIYWRLHGRHSYSYRYTDDDLALLKGMLAEHGSEQLAYVMFNNVSMREDALRFGRALANDEAAGIIRTNGWSSEVREGSASDLDEVSSLFDRQRR